MRHKTKVSGLGIKRKYESKKERNTTAEKRLRSRVASHESSLPIRQHDKTRRTENHTTYHFRIVFTYGSMLADCGHDPVEFELLLCVRNEGRQRLDS